MRVESLEQQEVGLPYISVHAEILEMQSLNMLQHGIVAEYQVVPDMAESPRIELIDLTEDDEDSSAGIQQQDSQIAMPLMSLQVSSVCSSLGDCSAMYVVIDGAFPQTDFLFSRAYQLIWVRTAILNGFDD
uniref:Uncharacterized protein n=1 Tax=Angiostrongylus cantonensis TaxID=6313 RepID=A0A0K0D6S8_ANGCA